MQPCTFLNGCFCVTMETSCSRTRNHVMALKVILFPVGLLRSRLCLCSAFHAPSRDKGKGRDMGNKEETPGHHPPWLQSHKAPLAVSASLSEKPASLTSLKDSRGHFFLREKHSKAGARGITQFVKCLPFHHEDLSSVLRKPSVQQVQACNSRPEKANS